MLTLLINFPARQEISALKNMDPGKVKGMVFYQDMLLDNFWGWISNLEAHVKRKKQSQSRPLALAGVCTVLQGQEMPPKPDEFPQDARYYIQRARYHGYVHNPEEFMDNLRDDFSV